jgi:hypothetical protein
VTALLSIRVRADMADMDVELDVPGGAYPRVVAGAALRAWMRGAVEVRLSIGDDERGYSADHLAPADPRLAVTTAAALLRAGAPEQRSAARAILEHLLGPGMGPGQCDLVRAALAADEANEPDRAALILDGVHERALPRCAVCGLEQGEMYMLRDEVWAGAGLARRDHAHLRCVAARLGRDVVPADLTRAPINDALRYAMGRDPECARRGCVLPSPHPGRNHRWATGMEFTTGRDVDAPPARARAAARRAIEILDEAAARELDELARARRGAYARAREAARLPCAWRGARLADVPHDVRAEVRDLQEDAARAHRELEEARERHAELRAVEVERWRDVLGGAP